MESPQSVGTSYVAWSTGRLLDGQEIQNKEDISLHPIVLALSFWKWVEWKCRQVEKEEGPSELSLPAKTQNNYNWFEVSTDPISPIKLITPKFPIPKNIRPMNNVPDLREAKLQK